MTKSSRHTLMMVQCAITALFLVTACQDAGSEGPLSEETYAGKGQFVELTPDVAEIVTAGEQVKLSAKVRDGKGVQVQNARVEYESFNPSVATVDWDGTVTGMSEGVAEIQGTYGTAKATAVIAVSKPVLRKAGASVTISPELAEIPTIGGTYKLLAVGRNTSGKLVANSSLTWETLRSEVATVNGGVVTGRSKGETRIVVRNGDASDTAVVVVAPANAAARVRVTPKADTIPQVGNSIQLKGEVLNGSYEPVQNATLEWESLDKTIAKVSNAGIVTANAKGVARIRLFYGSLADTARVYVAPTATATSLYITPKADSIKAIGATTQLTATILDGNNQVVTSVKPGWSTLNAAIATVDANGVVRGLAKGTARITAKLNALADTAIVHVVPAPVPTAPYRVVITPKVDTVGVNATVTLQAKVYDKNNNEFASMQPTWSSLNTTIATVSTGTSAVPSTDVKGLKVGSVKIVAKYNTTADTAQVLVSSTSTGGAALVIAPRLDTIPKVGGSVTLTVSVFNAQQQAMSGVEVQWESLDKTIAKVSNAGEVTSYAKGTARIRAFYGTLTDTATILVEPSGTTVTPTPTPNSIVITPKVDTIPTVNGTIQLNAVVKVNSQVATGVAVQWWSLDKTTATVSNDGAVSGLAQGVARIVAEYNGMADTATVHVAPGGSTGGPTTPGPWVTVSPKTAVIMNVGGVTSLSATARDAQGNTVSQSSITWTSLDPSIAGVSNGQVTGLALGAARIQVSYSNLADTATVTVTQIQLPPPGVNLTPANLMPLIGPVVANSPSISATQSYDSRFVQYENRVLCHTNGTCVKSGYGAQLDLVNAGAANTANHYGALRGRLMWAIRNGEPYGPGVTDVNQSVYARGRHIVKEYLKWSKAHGFWNQQHNNTGLNDVEALWVLEGDVDARTHIHASAQQHTYDSWGYLHMVSINSDFRQIAVALQAFNAAHRLGIPYTDVKDITGASGPALDPAPGSWKAAGERLLSWILDGDPNFKHASKGLFPTPPAILPNGMLPAPAAFQTYPLSQAQLAPSEVYFMNAMFAIELLRWSAFVAPHPRAEQAARSIVDHLIDELNRRGTTSLPFVGKDGGSAPDLSGFYIWPALVMWQETGDQKYYDFAMKNLQANENAYLWGAKQFNETFSLGGHGTEALMSGVRWR